MVSPVKVARAKAIRRLHLVFDLFAVRGMSGDERGVADGAVGEVHVNLLSVVL